jgi:hypothetical protein
MILLLHLSTFAPPIQIANSSCQWVFYLLVWYNRASTHCTLHNFKPVYSFLISYCRSALIVVFLSKFRATTNFFSRRTYLGYLMQSYSIYACYYPCLPCVFTTSAMPVQMYGNQPYVPPQCHCSSMRDTIIPAETVTMHTTKPPSP